MQHNGLSLEGPALSVVDDGYQVGDIAVSPRVGINVARGKPWRFFISSSPSVSRVKENRNAKRLKGQPKGRQKGMRLSDQVLA